ncbi:hypothetical protein C0J29_08725 [Mycobacterium paragordonae]|nr:hypothetical protein C0J29_08725 [Mycobacterium paragordonae]PJE24698.1 MAG: hypothetical protein CK431_04725 [Mycobacterium sp.]TDK97144.1 hypothetical protein EI067_13635 [Mycobacterium paragordonae]TDK99794.1 hypothetical protein EUA02_06390 [Mycobacterium paragordonae]TDL06183.1 hypothetical protein EUA05_17200 [Mycobacterium paragordonae]
MSEQTRIAEIERRLMEQFPGISIEVLDAAVREHHSRFQASPIRDFIPLLVEKRVRQELAEASLSHPVA